MKLLWLIPVVASTAIPDSGVSTGTKDLSKRDDAYVFDVTFRVGPAGANVAPFSGSVYVQDGLTPLVRSGSGSSISDHGYNAFRGIVYFTFTHGYNQYSASTRFGVYVDTGLIVDSNGRPIYGTAPRKACIDYSPHGPTDVCSVTITRSK
uniref:SIX10 n=1 Tax=Fusarium oxysporum f. sp. physali TaxID=2212625 RepID=A0A2U9DML3_FUSOX|nr:SIX10 [Fusarium oxysporum f. sp. physali]QQY97449.1 secreted in the xylem 10 [Fusarium oxysporum f. sp. physali]QQY97465.1 secreted in the xylem 10 [Fusarium oxysporum f. sp. physali]QQY97481.1 secreted in the xylem 10 [Fusarium oxysporum f. sp. physali]